jgi:hypothetical protein
MTVLFVIIAHPIAAVSVIPQPPDRTVFYWHYTALVQMYGSGRRSGHNTTVKEGQLTRELLVRLATSCT